MAQSGEPRTHGGRSPAEENTKEAAGRSHRDPVKEEAPRVSPTSPTGAAPVDAAAGQESSSAPVFMPPETPPAAAALLAQAAEDPGLRAAVLPRAAHLNLAVDGAGDLSLHLRVRDGVADVRVDGPAAQLLNRVSQLEAALATEGLQLGQFNLGQQEDRSRRSPADPEEAPAPGGRQPALRAAGETTATQEQTSGVHVRA